MSLYKVLDTLNTDQGNIPDIKYNKQTMECESKKKLLKLPIPYNLQLELWLKCDPFGL